MLKHHELDIDTTYRQVSGVSAFIPESLFVTPDVVSVPGEEVALWRGQYLMCSSARLI